MNIKTKTNFTEGSFFDDSQKNYYIKIALKELAYDVTQNPTKYITEKYISCKTRHIALKEITYILLQSICDYLNFAMQSNIDTEIVSEVNSKLNLKRFIRINLHKLKDDKNYQKDSNLCIEKYLSKFYNNDKVSSDPIIQFIFWSIKNIPKLCINPNKEVLTYDLNTILKNYFDNVFFAIDKYNSDTSKMTYSEIRNFLCSVFIDEILTTEYYQKTFE